MHALVVLLAVGMSLATKAFTSSPVSFASSRALSRALSRKSTHRFRPLRSTATTTPTSPPTAVTTADPLRVIIAGGGVGGLTLANVLCKNPKFRVTILEKTSAFKRFGGPIQLASNAMQILKDLDATTYDQILAKFTYTGDKENGIKDGIRDEWYAKFDLATPAEKRGLPYTGVIERPDLQEIFLGSLASSAPTRGIDGEEIVKNGNGVTSYKKHASGEVTVTLENGEEMTGDVLIGADGIWSSVRATMRDEPVRGDAAGVSYSGYTVFAGELNYDSPDNGDVGYKVYIGPGIYFVITDIGNGRYQWYAFKSAPANSVELEEKPDGSVAYLKELFKGWSPDVHRILDATKELEIQQRDLYDRPPSVSKPWCDEHVALLGDAVHAMMPNLGQGGCQAIEDALVISEELIAVTDRSEITQKLKTYRERRLVRSAAVQGLSRFASDIIIRGFDIPFKYVDGRFENFSYAGVVTRMLQPILPIFFKIQFAFLYDGYDNKRVIDFKAGFGLLSVGLLILLIAGGAIEEGGILAGLGLETIFGTEGIEAFLSNFQGLF